MSTKTLVKVGKLYSCEDYFLMLYPDQEAAFTAARAGTGGAPPPSTTGAAENAAAERAAGLWSNRLGKPVLYAKKNIPLLILNNREKYVEVLVGDKKGWIIYQDWLELKEIV